MTDPGRPGEGEQEQDQPVELPILAAPADGVPEVVDTPEAFEAMVSALSGGSGPVAVDAERAQAYRYSARAYLIQLRREGSGTHLLDPLPFQPADFARLQEVLAPHEWIIHAATQDIPCLAELGLVPQRLFDTELAGRLLHRPRVALGALIEEHFGLRLLKEHSMADWSSRPLPPEWLTYAALDVELLVPLRDAMAAQLAAAERLDWAEQEFAHLAAHAGDPPTVREDRWRRTSGMHAVKKPAGLAVVRELWRARDEIARRTDKAPGKVLPDKAISEFAAGEDRGRDALRRIEGFKRRTARRYEANWLAAADRAAALSRKELPPARVPSEGPPPPRSWERNSPEAYARWLRARDAVNSLAEEIGLPAENMITPDLWRRLCWRPPETVDAANVDAFLADLGARQWQRDLVVPVLVAAIEPPGTAD